MKQYLTILSFGVLMLSSCSAPQTLYSWYNYDKVTHAYDKKTNKKTTEALMNNYDEIIKKQKGIRKVVPPGLLAERGYYYLKNGKKKEAMELFKKEKELYPESTIFIDRIIKRIEK